EARRLEGKRLRCQRRKRKTAILVELGNGIITERRELIQKCSWRIMNRALRLCRLRPFQFGSCIAPHLPTHDHSPPNSEDLQHTGDRLAQLRTRHADELGAWPSGIQQRAKKIKYRALAAIGAELPRRSNVPKGGMVLRREKESEAQLTQRTGSLVGR